MIRRTDDAEPMLALFASIRNHMHGSRANVIVGEAYTKSIPFHGLCLDRCTDLAISRPVRIPVQFQAEVSVERIQPKLHILDRCKISKVVESDDV
jgi:hypothetical protein